jgi:ribonucleotide monophosphatase NagD (HAD superfamily)
MFEPNSFPASTLPTAELMQQLYKRLYAIPEHMLREMLDAVECEYVNRQAAKAGFLETADEAF